MTQEILRDVRIQSLRVQVTSNIEVSFGVASGFSQRRDLFYCVLFRAGNHRHRFAIDAYQGFQLVNQVGQVCSAGAHCRKIGSHKRFTFRAGFLQFRQVLFFQWTLYALPVIDYLLQHNTSTR